MSAEVRQRPTPPPARPKPATGGMSKTKKVFLSAAASSVFFWFYMMVTYAPSATMKNGPNGLLGATVMSAYMAVIFGVFVLGILAAIFLRSKYIPPSQDFHGSARFSTESEMEEFFLPAGELMPPGGFYLGPAEGGSIVLPRAITVKHGVIIGGPGGLPPSNESKIECRVSTARAG